METEVLLYSGGIDSFLAYQYLKIMGHNPRCVYFDLGHRYAKQELSLMESPSFINNVCKVTVSKCLQLWALEAPDAYIPNRNLLAAIQAVGQFGATKVWIGGTASDRVNDNNYDVFQKLSDLLSDMHGKKIEVTSPFWTSHKHQIVEDYYLRWHTTFGDSTSAKQIALIDNTFSCYSPIDSHQVMYYTWLHNASNLSPSESSKYVVNTTECMKCPACFRKSVALLSANIFRPFDDSKVAARYINEASMSSSTVFSNSGNSDMIPRYNATLDYDAQLKRYNNDCKRG